MNTHSGYSSSPAQTEGSLLEGPPDEGTHEQVQAEQPELGKVRALRAPKARKGSGKKSGKKPGKKRAASRKPSKSSKKPARRSAATRKTASKKAKASKTAKVPKPAGPGRGIRADGKPRRKPGTNPPKTEAAGIYGRKIAKARKAQELTQKALAAKVGLSQPGLANIERGVGPAGEKTRAKLEKALGL